jgi:hypothetical protein
MSYPNGGYQSNNSNRNENAMVIKNTGKVGINTRDPDVRLDINSTDAIRIPVGTEAQRPTPTTKTGLIRYNTDTKQFEGHGENWGSLEGLIDVNRDTFISAENSSGINNDQLKFFTGDDTTTSENPVSHLRMIIDKTGDISMNDNLNVDGDVSMNQKLFVNGDVSLNQKLFVGGDVSLNQKLFVNGDVSLNQKLFVNGDVSLNSKLAVVGDLTVDTIKELTTDSGVTIEGVTLKDNNITTSGTINGITYTKLGYLSNVTSDIQTQIDSKQATIDTSNRLNSNLIGDGNVSNAEFGYLDGVTSAIQTQINSKQATIDTSNRLNANLINDGNVSNAAFGYLSNVTSDIQSQIDSISTPGHVKEFTVTVATKTTNHPYPPGNGSTYGYRIDGVESPVVEFKSGYTYKFDQSHATNGNHPLRFYLVDNKNFSYTTGVTESGTPGSAGAYTQIVVNDNTPTKLFYQCGSHAYMGYYCAVQLASSDVTNTEFGYLSGVTSDIQTQINNAGGATDINGLSDGQYGGSDNYNTPLAYSYLIGTGHNENIAANAATGSTHNTGMGYNSFIKLTTGMLNTGMGSNALYHLKTGKKNVAIGAWSMSGVNNLDQTPENNVAIGAYALQDNYGGSYNVGVGVQALADINTGDRNTGIGYQSLFKIKTTSDNLAIGYQSLLNLQDDCSKNVAIGNYSQEEGTSQSVGNTSLGHGSLQEGKYGFDYHTAIGFEALKNNGKRNYSYPTHQNTAIGYQAGYASNFGTAGTTGSYCTFLGSKTTWQTNTDYSTAIGYNAKITDSDQIMLGGQNDSGAYPEVYVPGNMQVVGNMTITGTLTASVDLEIDLDTEIGFPIGLNSLDSMYFGTNALGGSSIYNCLAIGHDALKVATTSGTTTAENTISIGEDSCRQVAVCQDSVVIGYRACENLNGNIIDSVAIGFESMHDSVGSASNVGVGYRSLINIKAPGNCAIGTNALNDLLGKEGASYVPMTNQNNIYGIFNVALGHDSGKYLQNGVGNTFLGARTWPDANVTGANKFHYTTAIGYNAHPTKDNQMVLGGLSKTVNNANNAAEYTVEDYPEVYIPGSLVVQGGGNVDSNTAVGMNAMSVNTTGTGNTAFGKDALESNKTHNHNTAIGWSALKYTKAVGNTAIGSTAGDSNVTGEYNTFLGYGADFSTPSNYNYSTAVGYRSKITKSNQIALGRKVGTGWTTAPEIFMPGKVGIGTDNPVKELQVNTAVDWGGIVIKDDTTDINLVVFGRATSDNHGYVNVWGGGNGSQVFLNGAGKSYVNNGYNFGIGTNSPGALLDVNGDINANGTVSQTSDKRIKTNIQDIIDSNALDIIRKIKPKTYNYIDTENRTTDKVYGFIAQEVKEILPYAVKNASIEIPNVYQDATVLDNTITFDNFNVNNLEYDDENNKYHPLIICDTKNNNKKIKIEIVNIMTSRSITVDQNLQQYIKPIDNSLLKPNEFVKGNQVFIYGQYVNNGNALCKEHIWSVSTAALQEVDKQLQEEKTNSIELSNRVSYLETQLNTVLDILNKNNIT